MPSGSMPSPERIWLMENKATLNKTVRADFKMGLKRAFLFAVLGVFLGFCFDNWEGLKTAFYSSAQYGDDSVICVMYYFFNSFSFGGVFSQYFATIMAALPFSANYCEEVKGGMSIYKIARCGRREYVCSKFWVASLLGGLALLLGGLAFSAALASRLPIVTSSKLFESEWIPFYHALTIGNGLPYMAIVLYISFLGGALWASVGLCVSAYFPSAYIAVCAPFIFRFVLTEIGRLLKLPNEFRLEMLLSARGEICTDAVTLVVTTLEVLAVILICYFLFVKRMKRRIWDV